MKLTDKEIYSPRLVGGRFNDHRLPLSLMDDISVLDVLTKDLARHIFFEENPNRKRLPNGFYEGVNLKLDSLEEGSTILKILLITASNLLFDATNITYFEKASERIENAIRAAELGEDITEFVPPQFLMHFNRLGRKLNDDEFIEFHPDSDVKAVLSQSSRKRLIQAGGLIEYKEFIQIRGKISSIDKYERKFKILDGRGVVSHGVFEDKDHEMISDAFLLFEKNAKVCVSGLARFSKHGKLIEIERIESVDFIDPLDVFARTEELSTLKNGWMNGQGKKLSKDGLSWLAKELNSKISEDFPLPHIFPTTDNAVQLEWEKEDWSIEVEINLESKGCNVFAYKYNDDNAEHDFELNLRDPKEWEVLSKFIKDIEANVIE